jgi:transcriptional regulator with XRE-family HTH domain
MDKDSDVSFFGEELRRLRLAAGISSQEELAARLGYERTVVAKAESGHRPPSPDVAEAYARMFPGFNALVENGLIERWAAHVRKNGGSFPRQFVPWVDAEKDATALFYWAPILVPGVLQTEAYARTTLACVSDENESLEARLAGRMERQQILTRPNPPLVSVVMSEAVLHRCVGGAAVMREQLIHLAEIGERLPKVTVQVIPAEVATHAGLEGAGSIAEREGSPTVVHMESLTAAQTTGEPDIVAKVRELTGMLRCEAFPRGASRDLILKVAEQL